MKNSSEHRWGARDLSLIAMFAAFLVVVSVVPPIQIGNMLSVPLTLQTLVITLTGLLLGAGRASAAVGLYVVLGLLGLPVFAGFRGGIAVLAGPSAGYLLSFVLVAAVIGAVASFGLRHSRSQAALGSWFGLAALTGLLLNHAVGIVGMMINGRLSPEAAIAADIVFIPGDLVKAALAVLIALSLHRAFPALPARIPRRGADRGANRAEHTQSAESRV
ncbi:biotin transporter BioY [Acaricomes phytoseiuli]|uniref:biotin transporter BioY n=1 Tax=Acaricomes phytoseiuli TaxID=291968 RepID=UPI0003A1F2FE|nr:biotin transporter BioY [Acaricomes phytoseiuli]MCW1250267.1 biotin transporter BioY [Acaricomes phytoseiuli]